MPLVLVGLSVGLDVLFVGIVLYALYRSFDAWARPLAAALHHPKTGFWGAVIKYAGIAVSPLNKLLGKSLAFTLGYARAYIGRAVAHMVRPLSHFLGSLALLVETWAYNYGAFTGEVWRALNWLRHITIPKLIHVAVAPVREIAVGARDLARATDRALDTAAAGIGDVLSDLGWATTGVMPRALLNFANAFDNLWRYTRGVLTQRVNYALDVAIPRLAERVQGIGDRITDYVEPILSDVVTAVDQLVIDIYGDIRPRLDALYEGFVPAALIAGVIAALSLAWDGLFCRNTNLMGRRLCRLDNALMEGFLETLFGVAIILNLREYVELEQRLMQITAGGIKDLLEV